MARQVGVVLSEGELAALDAAIADGRFPSRPAALRAGLRLALAGEQEPAPPDAGRTVPTRALTPVDGPRVELLKTWPHPAAVVARELAVPVLTSAAVALAGRLVRGLRPPDRSRSLRRRPEVSPPVPGVAPGVAARYRSQVDLLLVRRGDAEG